MLFLIHLWFFSV